FTVCPVLSCYFFFLLCLSLCSFLFLRLPLVFTLFPYTTLFRSCFVCSYNSFVILVGTNVSPSPAIYNTGRSVFSTCSRAEETDLDRKSTRLNSSHVSISYAVFCLKKKKVYTCDIPY